MDKKYKEFKVRGRMVKGEFVIEKKEPTERGHVMISERDAEINNAQTRFNNFYYEAVKEPVRPKKEAVKETEKK